MQVGWTQNMVILDTDLTMQERSWYLWSVAEYGWSKNELKKQIENDTHLSRPLDDSTISC